MYFGVDWPRLKGRRKCEMKHPPIIPARENHSGATPPPGTN